VAQGSSKTRSRVSQRLHSSQHWIVGIISQFIDHSNRRSLFRLRETWKVCHPRAPFFQHHTNDALTTLRLVKLLEQISAESAKVLIFIGTKRVADDLTKYLRQDGWPALAIHGDKQQQERDWVLAEFKSGRSPIMIATDVASRGLGSYSFSSPHYTPSSSTPFDSTRTTLAVFFKRRNSR
jgi:superfamily II DNA/RNA helicase